MDAESRERARVYRSLLVVGALVVVGWLLWSARGALSPFVLGAVIAYLLSPLVDRVERLLPRRGRLEGASRALSIVVVYLITLAILAGLVLTVGQKLLNETLDFVDAFPGYVDTARERQHDLQAWYENPRAG